MDHIAALVGIGVVAFVSTNIDDLVVLLGFFADADYRPRQIIVGQFAGMAALIALALVGARAAQLIPLAYAGLLGLIPIAIAVKMLIVPQSGAASAERRARATSNTLTVAVVTIANGGDNLGLYIPLFAVHGGGEVALFVAVFLAMTALWCAVGCALVSDRLFGVPARRWGRLALPYVLIALGIYIFARSGVLAG